MDQFPNKIGCPIKLHGVDEYCNGLLNFEGPGNFTPKPIGGPELTEMSNKYSFDITLKLQETTAAFLKQIYDDFNLRLEEYLKKHLEDIGYTFDSKESFYSFIKGKVTRVEEEGNEEVYYYLNFVDKDNKGILIGITHENRVNFDTDFRDGSISASIG